MVFYIIYVTTHSVSVKENRIWNWNLFIDRSDIGMRNDKKKNMHQAQIMKHFSEHLDYFKKYSSFNNVKYDVELNNLETFVNTISVIPHLLLENYPNSFLYSLVYDNYRFLSINYTWKNLFQLGNTKNCWKFLFSNFH